jgi:hypothetical protein
MQACAASYGSHRIAYRFRGASDENCFTRLEIVSEAGKLAKWVYTSCRFRVQKRKSHINLVERVIFGEQNKQTDFVPAKRIR